MIYVLDTHALVWFLTDDPRLGRRASALFDDRAARFVVPTLVLCEIYYLAHRGRLAQDMTKVLTYLKSDERFEITPLDERTLHHFPAGLDIHDAIIVAAVRALAKDRKVRSLLVTHDDDITRSGIVEVVWN